MRHDEYRNHDATALAALVRRKEVTPEELLDAAVAAVERLNPAVNAVVTKMYDEARRLVAAGLPEGPFTGVPLLLKDYLQAYAGFPLSSGCTFWGDYRPPRHSGLVKRFLDAGFVVIGKTNTPELGILPITEPPRFGPARNPWDIERSAGGSSGGSAAAVSAGMVPVAGGGDGGGSIRIPASCCGIFGFKPSRGRHPTSPYLIDWEGFTQEHVLTRSVRDSAAVLDVTNVPEPGAPYFTPPGPTSFLSALDERPKKLRVAVSAEPVLGRATHPDCRAAVEDAARLLRELGHDVVEAAPAIDRRAFIENWVLMIAGQVAADIREGERVVGRKATQADFQSTTWLSYVIGRTLSAEGYVGAVRALLREGAKFSEFLEGFDVWLSPTLGQPPVEHGAFEARGAMAALQRAAGRLRAGRVVLWSGQTVATAEPHFDFASFTPIVNAGGQPAASVPLFWNAQNLPIGVQLVARFGQDALLLRLARELELARPWAERRPALFG